MVMNGDIQNGLTGRSNSNIQIQPDLIPVSSDGIEQVVALRNRADLTSNINSVASNCVDGLDRDERVFSTTKILKDVQAFLEFLVCVECIEDNSWWGRRRWSRGSSNCNRLTIAFC